MTSPGIPSEPANAARPESGAGPGVAPPAGRVLAGRYEVLEALGTGPLLAAFRARDRALNRIVVVKTLLPALESGERAVVLANRVRAGLSGVVSLSHANVTRVYDVGRDDAPENDGPTFLAEEYVRGIDLKERIRRVAPFSLTASVDVAVAIAEALEYAHARGVVHGDLRPQNVLIGPEGQIKVSNFGLSSALALLADPATLLAVVPYTAPEVAESRTASAPGDLYALGVVLYEMLVGDLPYRGESPAEIARRHASDPVPAPRVLNPGVPRALDGLVQKALAKRPDERYGSASALLADLRILRDALRQGASLSWSPLDAAAASAAATNGASAAHGGGGGSANVGDETATIMTAGRRASPVVLSREAESTIVMPTPSRAAARTGNGRRAVAASDQPRGNGGRWLTTLNLFLFTLLVASVAALCAYAQFFVRAPGT
jgi:serine/threonine-protein kinase